MERVSITLWDLERRSQKGATESEEAVVAIVPTEESLDSQMQTSVNGEERSGESAVPVAVVVAPLDSDWILHHNLVSASTPGPESTLRIHPMLADLRADVLSGRQDDLASKLTDVFRKHLEAVERPYLAFSASIPSLVALLGCANLPASGGVRAISSADETASSGQAGCKYFQCAALIRHLMNTSQFGETPPARRPETIARDSFVRELCAQVGLSLDLARLAFAHSRELRSAAAASQRTEEPATPASAAPQLRLQDAAAEASGTEEAITSVARECAETQQDTDEQAPDSQISQSCASTAGCTSTGSSHCCVRSTEVKGALARAGRYMAAMQMDMERLHDEHVARKRRAGAEPGQAEPASEKVEPRAASDMQQVDADALAITDGIEQLEPGPHARPLAHDLDDEELMTQLPLDFPSVSAEQARQKAEDEEKETKRRELEVRSLLAAASSEPPLEENTVAGLEAPPTNPASALADAAVLDDPLVMPPFGKFLNEQLLPLYLGDVPFESLKHLINNYCGIPMDEDDEARAWKVLGRPVPKRKSKDKKAKRPPSRESSNAGDKPRLPTTPADRAAPEAADSLDVDLSLSGRSLRRRASAEAVPFSELRQAVETKGTMGPPTMRAQMLTSAVEKRRTDNAAPANMTLSLNTRTRLRSNSSNSLTSQAPTPGIKPSLALLNTPCNDVLGTPISDRKAAWREQQNAVLANTSTRNPRSDNRLLVRSSPAPEQPNWGLLDTPVKPRPL